MYRTYFIIVIGLFSIITSVGCDQLKGVKDKITGDDKIKAAAPKMAAPATKVKSESAQPKMTADTLARVGNWTITKAEFNERLSALKEVLPEFDITDTNNRQDVLEELIRQQLVVLDAETTGFANQSDIKAAVEEFRRTLIVREIAMDKTENISVTEDEARQLYEENKELLVEPLKLRVREIVVKDKDNAESLLIQILQGADFAATAKANSISGSADDGGDLGYLEEIPFPQMGNQLATLEEGDVSGVFSGPEGFYIVKVEEKSGGEPLEYSEVKDMLIEQQTLIKQQEAVLDYIDELRAKYPVDINEELLK